MVSLQEQETLQLRVLKLLTPIKGTFPLYTLPLRIQLETSSCNILDVLSKVVLVYIR